MNSDSIIGLKGIMLLFAAFVITVASSQGGPGGRFDRFTRVARKPTTTIASASTVTTATATTTATAPVATATTSNALYTELSAIPSNFDTAAEVGPACNYTGGNPGCIPNASGDNVGAFRFLCAPGQLLRDDPIVYPGRPGASHLHQFFGNLDANANSTYASLRSSGESTCASKVNRSAYWMPAMLDGVGNAVRPDHVSIYYKRLPISDPGCSLSSGAPKIKGNCVPLPNGLRFIFGYDMITNTPPTGRAYFTCAGPTANATQDYPSITAAMAACPTTPTLVKQWDGTMKPVYNQLGAVIIAPDCWDGKNLDSANHRDHVSYASYGDWGYEKCPATHPFVIPTFTMGVWFNVDANLGTWHLSSDEMRPGIAPGTTFHADWFGGWDNQVEALWLDNCINKHLSCSGGELGNGSQMIEGPHARLGVLAGLVPLSTIP